MNYKKYNDYELIYNVRENDDYSYNCLFNKYVPVMKKLAYKYYSNFKGYGCELEDFQQEAYISFYNAVNSYSEDKNSLFYSFVVLCINRALTTFCKKISCEKKNINNNYLINIDDEPFVVGENNIDSYYEESSIKDFIKSIYLDMNLEESCIVELRYNGFTYKEISILLDIPLRRVQFKGKKVKEIINSKI